MAETISPVVHGGRNRSYWSAVALHALGATISAAALGAVLGALGMLFGAPWGEAALYVLAALALIYLAREVFALPVPVPARSRQVPEWWRTFYSPKVTSFLYGLGLGLGYMTYLAYGTLLVVSVACLMTGDPLLGALLGGVFGAARAAAVAASPLLLRAPDAAPRWPQPLNALALIAIAATALTL